MTERIVKVFIDRQRPGTSIVYFNVADVRKASAELERKGISFVGPVETVNRTATHDLLLRIFKDTDNIPPGEDFVNVLEQTVGRDLQYIRINGTLVGGMVGLILHALDAL